MHPADLEAFVDEALGGLPEPRAPHTLLPRVLAAAQHWSLRPWYARAWFTWPRGWQVAAVIALSAIAGASAVLLPGLYGTAVQVTLPVVGRFATAADYMTVAADVGQVLWRTLLQPLAEYAFAFVLVMCLACAVFGMALNQVVLGRMSER